MCKECNIFGNESMSKEFNLHFTNVAANIKDSINPTDKPPDSYLDKSASSFQMPMITEWLLNLKPQNLKCYKTSKPQNLKFTKHQITKPQKNKIHKTSNHKISKLQNIK